MDGSFYRFGNSQQCLNGNDFFTALDFAKIFRVQICQLSQSFLGKIGFLSTQANGITNHPAVP